MLPHYLRASLDEENVADLPGDQRGHRKVVIAIFIQAVEDRVAGIRARKVLDSGKSVRSRQVLKRTIGFGDDAYEWITNQSSPPFSFNRTCGVLRLRASNIRQMLEDENGAVAVLNKLYTNDQRHCRGRSDLAEITH